MKNILVLILHLHSTLGFMQGNCILLSCIECTETESCAFAEMRNKELLCISKDRIFELPVKRTISRKRCNQILGIKKDVMKEKLEPTTIPIPIKKENNSTPFPPFHLDETAPTNSTFIEVPDVDDNSIQLPDSHLDENEMSINVTEIEGKETQSTHEHEEGNSLPAATNSTFTEDIDITIPTDYDEGFLSTFFNSSHPWECKDTNDTVICVYGLYTCKFVNGSYQEGILDQKDRSLCRSSYLLHRFMRIEDDESQKIWNEQNPMIDEKDRCEWLRNRRRNCGMIQMFLNTANAKGPEILTVIFCTAILMTNFMKKRLI